MTATSEQSKWVGRSTLVESELGLPADGGETIIHQGCMKADVVVQPGGSCINEVVDPRHL